MLASVMIPRIKENLLNGRLFGVIFMSGGFVVVVFQSGFLFPFFACVCVCVFVFVFVFRCGSCDCCFLSVLVYCVLCFVLLLIVFVVFGFLSFWVLWFLSSVLQLLNRRRVKYQMEGIKAMTM